MEDCRAARATSKSEEVCLPPDYLLDAMAVTVAKQLLIARGPPDRLRRLYSAVPTTGRNRMGPRIYVVISKQEALQCTGRHPATPQADHA